MKRLLLFLFLSVSTFFVSQSLIGQTTLISPTGDGGFETGTTFSANGWTVVNHTTNTWQVGTVATPFAGTRGAYVSNDGGTSWAYTNSTSQTSHFYRDISVPAGEVLINLNFQWKGNGESGWDRLLVYTAPTSVTPVAGTPASNSTALTGATLVYTQASFLQSSYTAATISLPGSLAGTTFRLIFTWQNDNLGGTSPGAAVDNISLTSALPATYYWVGTTGGDWNTAANWNTAADGTGSNRTSASSSDLLIVDGMGTTAGTTGTISITTGESVGVLRVTNNTALTLQSSNTTTKTITITGGTGDDLDIQSGSSIIMNSSNNPVALAFSGTGNTGNIAGTLTFGGSTSNTVTTTGGTGTVVTVTSSGIVNLGAAGNTLVGSTATLNFANGSNCNSSGATTGAPPVPLATWGASSNLTITGLTTSSTAPTNNAQTFGNLTYNCTSATGTMSWFTSTTTGVIQGNLTIQATNTGKFRVTTSGTLNITGNLVVNGGTCEIASTSGTVTVAGGVTLAGGTLDITSGSSTATLKVAGTFNQSGGTLSVSGTSSTNSFEFNGSSAQNVTLGTTSGPLVYRITNSSGINLTGTMSINTNGGLRISTIAATPISGGTLTYSGTAPTTLTYDASTGQQTATAKEFPSSSGPANLTINNTSSAGNNIVNIPFDRTVSGTLTMTTGDINMGANTLTLGTGTATTGTLTLTAGAIVGKFKRWLSNTTGSRSFPVGILGTQRNVAINYTVAPTTGGTLTAEFIATNPGIAGLPLTEGSIIVNTSGKAGYWKLDAGDGLAGGTYTTTANATAFPGINDYTKLVLIKRPTSGDWVLNGTHVTTTGSNSAPILSRTGMTGFSEFGVGGDAAVNPLGVAIISVSTGNWGDGTTWNTGNVPTSGDNVTIANGHNVTLASGSPPYGAGALIINNGGTLTANANTLNVSTTLTNSGTISLGGSTINVSGTLTNSGSTTVSGGTLTVTGGSATGITNASGATFTVSGGTVTVGVGANNRTFSNSGTLTVSSSGTLTINGNLSIASLSTFNQSGGNINIDGNAAGNTTNSVASGTALVAINSALGTVNGGTMTIVDPSAATTATKALSYSVTSTSINWSAHNLYLGDGTSTDAGGAVNGFELDCYVGSGRLILGNVTVNGGSGTNRRTTSSASTGNGTWIGGTLTINANSEFRDGSATNTYFIGNIVNNGTMTNQAATLKLAGWNLGTNLETANTSSQTISGSGTFRNATTSPTASLLNLTINNNNATGVTLNVPLSVSGTLTMTSGLINTTATNILRLGTASAAGTLSGTPSATNMIVGPFARTFAASRTASGTYSSTTLYPVGKGSSYLPIWIDPSTSAGGAVIYSGEAFTSNSGSMGAGVSSLSQDRWEALPTTGGANVTNSFIQLGATGIASGNQILQATSAAGAYGTIPVTSTYTDGTPPTLKTGSALPVASLYGYFAYGNINNCSTPTAQPTNFVVTNKTSTSFTGSWTAASPPPSHYLVVRYGSGATPTNPVDFTTYTVGGTLGSGGNTGTVRYTGTGTTFNETGLSASTTYDYYVYSYNNSGCYGPVYLVSSPGPLTASVTTCGTVGAPGTPTSSNITSTGYTLTWTASSTSGATYVLDIAYDAAFTSFVPGYNGYDNGTALTKTVTGLSANTTYYNRVKAVSGQCSSAYTSTLTVFTGYCLSTSSGNSYYISNFVTTGGVSNISNNSAGWSTNGYGNFTAQSASNYVGSTVNYTTTWNTTGGVGYGIWIDWNNDLDFGDANETIYITSGYNFTTSYSGTINVPSGTPLGNYRMRIKIDYNSSGPTSCGSITDGETEDYTFTVISPPSCPAPTSLTATGITATTANIAWTAASPAPANGYQYYYSTSSTAPTGSTTPSGSVAAGTTTANLASLIQATTYYFWVRSNCGSGDYSTWAGSGTFTTACQASEVPYTVDFESAIVPALPICTANVNEGLGNNWVTASNPGSGFTSIALKYTYSTLYAANTWFFTNAINLTANTTYRIEFDYGNNSTSFTEKLKVAYGTSKTGAGMTNLIADFPSINTGALQHVYYDITPSSSGEFYFGFQAYSDADEYFLFVDNINIYIKPCPDPYWTVLPAASSSTVSNGSCIDASGWTHYNNGNNILLSLKLGGTGAVVTDVTVDPDGANDAVWVVNEGDGFPSVSAPGTGAAFMKRKWNVNASTQPSSDVDIRFYFTQTEYTAVNTVLGANSQAPLTATTQLNFYKVLNGMDPWAFGPLANANVAVITNGASAGINTWVQGTQGTEYYAEFKVAAFSGGGAGGADAGKALNSGVGLPIELLTFKGYADKNVNVLEWTTASEINTDKFIVERSIDSKKWEDVAEVESAGDSRITSSYKAIDDQPYSKAYYRLKSIDRDGRFQVSESIFIERNDRTFKLYSVSPNPNRGDFTVTFNAASDGESRLILVNSLGMRVHSQNVNSKAGTNAEYLNATDLTNGIYTLLIEQDGQIITQRVVINK